MHEEYVPVDYSKQSAAKNRDKLIWWWLYFFLQNDEFKRYCDANRNGDAAACAELESEFHRIAELYNDWGDIHILPSMMYEKSVQWQSWLTEKRHLFCADEIELLTPGAAQASSRGVQVLIPVGQRKDQLMNLFEEFLDTHPELLGAGPKYPIKEIRGNQPHTTLQRLENANLVYDLIVSGDEYDSYCKIVKLILTMPELQLEFKWFPTPADLIEIENFSQSKSATMINYSRTLRNLEEFYESCIASTIRGEFPAKTKQ